MICNLAKHTNTNETREGFGVCSPGPRMCGVLRSVDNAVSEIQREAGLEGQQHRSSAVPADDDCSCTVGTKGTC